MMPLADENPLRRTPWATLVLIGLCCAVYFGVQPIGRSLFDDVGFDRTQVEELRFSLAWAAIPCEVREGRPLTEGEAQATFIGGEASACGIDGNRSPAVEPGKHVYLALLISIFLHGSVSHLVGNLLFLWVFGNNIEDRRGPIGYLVFYLSAGLVAAAAQYALDPASTVPIVGASGAIAGVMGAYLVWFPRARIKTMIVLGPVFFRKIQAYWLLGVWFASQFLLTDGGGSVAWMAHVGGFVFGLLVGVAWRASDGREVQASPALAPSGSNWPPPV